MSSLTDRPSDEELRLFLERIARRLMEQPVELDASTHREKVAALLRKSGEASFYQMLSILPTASALEVHEAYERIARMVHPAHARRLNLEGRAAVLEVLFERVTQAYLTLSQLERRKRYDRELSPEQWAAAITPSGNRQEEARDMARRYFERAVELTVSDDYFFAVELAQQAARLDSRPEYHALLGRLQAKNHLWLRSAAENLQKALDLGSIDSELPVILARVREQLATGVVDPSEPRRRSPEDPEVEVVDPEEIDVPLPGGKSKSRKKK